IRAFGSLAQEVMDAGVAGVVAMRYNVYVVTAAQFVADLYAALAQGQSLGEAVTMGRKQLAAQPLREIAFEPRPLQDWPVPVVYEAAPINLFPKPAGRDGRPQGPPLQISLTSNVQSPTSNLPMPDVGFFGRDETLLALDRAFDPSTSSGQATQSVVLLHAYAGSGKTTTAAEFARWYAITGGLEGPVLFTSFETYKPLARVLDTIGQMFGEALEGAGINWLALGDDPSARSGQAPSARSGQATRRDVALQVLAQIPVLWIWDNVDPIAGFPAGTQSAWNSAEQKELKDFLLAARNTKAKFLLTSRRDEQTWLGNLPARLTLPPMPMLECVQLARSLVEKHGHRLTDVEDWRPLLQFTQGNPLTITVLVGQALREGRRKKADIEAFVVKLRAGEATF
ncbi:MAG: AAA family ATPase, partial [Chloroflexota bacterium]